MLSKLEQTELIDPNRQIVNITEKDEDKVILDWTNNNRTHYSTIDFPTIKIELRGAPDNILSVSEGLHNGEEVADFGINISTDLPVCLSFIIV